MNSLSKIRIYHSTQAYISVTLQFGTHVEKEWYCHWHKLSIFTHKLISFTKDIMPRIHICLINTIWYESIIFRYGFKLNMTLRHGCHCRIIKMVSSVGGWKLPCWVGGNKQAGSHYLLQYEKMPATYWLVCEFHTAVVSGRVWSAGNVSHWLY